MSLCFESRNFFLSVAVPQALRKAGPFYLEGARSETERTTGEKWWEVSSYDGVGRMRPLEGQEDPVKLVPEAQGSSCTVNARPSLGTHC